MHLTGQITDYFVVFWAGILVSFTPCVYPLMPITASFIAGMNTQGSRLKGLVISLVYVLGIAISYSLLAVVATLLGKVFGKFQNHPMTFLVVGNVLLFFALTMLDVISLPSFGMNSQGRLRPKNLWMVLAFGISSGFLVGPCTAPVLGTLLLYVAKKQNLLHAVSLVFIFAYGVGASLILIGTFSGLLGSLPKSGHWLKRVKQFCALILLIAAEYLFIKAGSLF
jgi:cytochrome c-type biogenesis protein